MLAINELVATLPNTVMDSTEFFRLFMIAFVACTAGNILLWRVTKSETVLNAGVPLLHSIMSVYTAYIVTFEEENTLAMSERFNAVMSPETTPLELTSGSSPLLVKMCAVSAAYFAADALSGAGCTTAELIHHVLGTVGFTVAGLFGSCQPFIVPLHFSEISTIVLHFMNLSEVYLPKLKFALGALFVATFFATRVAFAPIYSYAAFVRGFDSLVSLHPFLRSVAFVTIAAPPILNTFWGFFILQKACGELKKEKKDKEE